jgi:hypothetical protein
MTRNEIIEALRAINSETLSERKEDDLVLELDRALPFAEIIDLIYFADPELTPEKIADEALRRQAAGRPLT